MDSPIVAKRRQNLKLWIEQHYAGSQARFIAETSINQGELSSLLKNKSFGEKKARALEQAANMPTMWLDNSNPSVQEMDTEEMLPDNPPDTLLTRMPDSGMLPVIPPNSCLWINPTDTKIRDGKIYLIEYGGLQTVRRLFIRAYGYIGIISYQSCDYPAETLPASEIRIIGRIVQWCVQDSM